jgi:hypothetical protein
LRIAQEKIVTRNSEVAWSEVLLIHCEGKLTFGFRLYFEICRGFAGGTFLRQDS